MIVAIMTVLALFLFLLLYQQQLLVPEELDPLPCFFSYGVCG